MSYINHNLMGLDAADALKSHYLRLETSVKRLSSGLRINSAADDAAGLAIRELMRADIAALNQGIRNANDAISMLQVADGALGVIDEKLIRMKELAEQAATGTYNSTQRLMIHSEFVAMGQEIDRIARATAFNGVKLLDGSLSGRHNGRGLKATGALKVHFGPGNDSAEDYYYVEIGNCTMSGLGLAPGSGGAGGGSGAGGAPNPNDLPFDAFGMIRPPLNNLVTWTNNAPPYSLQDVQVSYPDAKENWLHTSMQQNVMFIIPQGVKNFVLNMTGAANGGPGDNDIELFTMDGKHLAGTPVYDSVDGNGNPAPADVVFDQEWNGRDHTDLASNCQDGGGRLPFNAADYDASQLNMGPDRWDGGNTLRFSTYNGMRIGYSGDGERQDPTPNDGVIQFNSKYSDYEVLTIDQVTEDLIVWLPGVVGGIFQYYMDYQGPAQPPHPDPRPDEPFPGEGPAMGAVALATQQEAQEALVKIDEAIVKKDKLRAHLGALQNRLENSMTSLAIQSENLLVSESRISDVDVAAEMSMFVRNQILTQSAVAMLGQANSYPHMLSQLING